MRHKLFSVDFVFILQPVSTATILDVSHCGGSDLVSSLVCMGRFILLPNLLRRQLPVSCIDNFISINHYSMYLCLRWIFASFSASPTRPALRTSSADWSTIPAASSWCATRQAIPTSVTLSSFSSSRFPSPTFSSSLSVCPTTALASTKVQRMDFQDLGFLERLTATVPYM